MSEESFKSNICLETKQHVKHTPEKGHRRPNAAAPFIGVAAEGRRIYLILPFRVRACIPDFLSLRPLLFLVSFDIFFALISLFDNVDIIVNNSTKFAQPISIGKNTKHIDLTKGRDTMH